MAGCGRRWPRRLTRSAGAGLGRRPPNASWTRLGTPALARRWAGCRGCLGGRWAGAPGGAAGGGRVVTFAPRAAPRAGRPRGPVQVLHTPGPGTPENPRGEDRGGVTFLEPADQFIDQAIPAGQMPPVITL